METVETRVLKSSFSGIKGAKKERNLLEKSSISYLGPGCREFESRHSDQKSRIRLCGVWTFCLYGETRKIKCGADERRRRGLDRAEPLSVPFGTDANESRHSDQNRQFSLRKLAVLTLEFGDPGTFVAGVTLIYSVNLIWIAAVRFKAIR